MLNYQRVSFKDGALLSKKLSCPLCSKVTPFVWTSATLLSKKPSCPLFGQQPHLFERKAPLTTRRIVHSQRPHTWKENCTSPRNTCACLKHTILFWLWLWRMHLIDTWCLRGQMNQIWLGLIWSNSKDQILEQNQNSKSKNKKNIGWPTLGWGEGRRLSNSRWLTLQWNKSMKSKKVGPGGGVSTCIYIYTCINVY